MFDQPIEKVIERPFPNIHFQSTPFVSELHARAQKPEGMDYAKEASIQSHVGVTVTDSLMGLGLKQLRCEPKLQAIGLRPDHSVVIAKKMIPVGSIESKSPKDEVLETIIFFFLNHSVLQYRNFLVSTISHIG